MTKIIAIANSKGGVAKSTSTIHLGVALSRMGKKVLLVDIDPQGHVSEGLGFDTRSLQYDISDILEGKHIDSLPNIADNLTILHSTIRLADMELTLVNMNFREYKLKKALEGIKSMYDYILIDCPPNLGMLTINALMAATHVLIPMSTEYYSMLGVASLIRTINTLKEANPVIEIMGVIYTRVKHTIHSQEVINMTRNEIGNDIKIFEPYIYESIRFSEAAGQGKTIFDTEPDHKGSLAYLEIAKQL